MFLKFIKFFVLFFLIKLCAILNTSFSSTSTTSSEDYDVKFKLGFEFQEISHLCPWNSRFDSFQNKPLFTIKYEEKTLWHLVIDTHDLEFVTAPFGSEDRDLLEKCMESINKSLSILKNILQQNNQELLKNEKEFWEREKNLFKDKNKLSKCIIKLEKDISFLKKDMDSINSQKEMMALIIKKKIKEDEYNDETLKMLVSKQFSIRKKIKEKENKLKKYRISLEDTQKSIQNTQFNSDHMRKITGKTTFSQWIKTLKKEFKDEELTLENNEEIFSTVSDKEIVLPRRYQDQDFWEPLFSPQATIQHPLRTTVPLYFSLFVLEHDDAYLKKYFKDFISALPNLNTYADNQNAIESDIDTLYSSLNGLLFLHAVTLLGMANSITENDGLALKTMLENYETYKQVDVKMNLFLMSRYSFSHMFRFVKNDCEYSFLDEYRNRIINGNNLFSDSGIQKNFCKVNYGQQFLDEDHKPRDLTIFVSFINKDFFESNKSNIKKLLRKGIISTSMIRNFFKNSLNDGILNGYFTETIKTVESDIKTRYDIEVKFNDAFFSEDETGLIVESRNNLSISLCHTDHDALSQPWFLDANDSMGKYSRNQEQVFSFEGGALIEMRRIEEVSPAFLKAYISLESDDGFLKKSELLSKQGCSLFDAIVCLINRLEDRDYRINIFKKIYANNKI